MIYDLLSICYYYFSCISSFISYNSTPQPLRAEQQNRGEPDPQVPGYDPSLYACERMSATARDGTPIPLSFVYRKGAFDKDKGGPMMLYGYGRCDILYLSIYIYSYSRCRYRSILIYIDICMYIYLHLYIYLSIYLFLSTCLYLSIYLSIFISISISISIYLLISVSIYIFYMYLPIECVCIPQGGL